MKLLDIHPVKQHKSLVIILLIMVTFSCKKQDDWLNIKRQNINVVPTTLSDMQAVLDDNNVMNSGYPVMGLIGTDNCYIPDANLKAASINQRNAYIWTKDIYQGGADYDWETLYQIVEYNNVVLDGLSHVTISPSNKDVYNNVKGSALFYRSVAFYNLAQLYCKPYSASTAATDLGIPIRLSSDVNAKSVRATVQQTYDQIVTDLKTAAESLPVTPVTKARPSRVAAYSMLAKTFLVMGDYTDAGLYADKSLSLNNSLLDYNDGTLITPTASYHFPAFTVGNPEITFFADGAGIFPVIPYASGTGFIDSNLYKSYNNNDLRKTLFYKDNGGGNIKYVSSYTGDPYNFCGLANDEIYLIRAECYARAGKTQQAMADLNTLLIKRFKTGTYVPYTATSADDALDQILQERRKELPMTSNVRWEDLRRLNKESRYAVTVTHQYDGIVYTLPPNDNRYVLPIPDVEIQINGLQQNSR